MSTKRIPTPATPAAEETAASAAAPETQAPAEQPETPAAPPEAPEDTSEPPADDTVMAVRVLVAFDTHMPNDVIELPRGEALVLEEQNQVDGHPEAVAYARSLQD